MGVVVRRYIDILTIIINFPYSTCISSFLAAASLLCSFFKCFFVLVYVIFVQYIIRDHSKKNRDHANIIISIIKNVKRASMAHTRESRDFHVRGTE